MTRVIGLDLSLTATGVSDGETFSDALKTKLTGHERLHWIVNQCIAVAADPRVSLVVVEGPSYGSKGSAVHQIAGLWWLVTHSLWERGVPFVEVTPSNLKKYATGKGNAGKDEVLAAVIRRWPGFTGSDNNEADAWVLAAMGRAHLGLASVEVPAVNREALAKTAWPETAVPA